MRWPRGALAFAVAAAATACSGCKSTMAHADAGNAEAAQVLARVGDRAITVGDYVAALQHMDEFDRIRYQSPERRRELLGEMIDVMLLADEARDKGYDQDAVTQQEIRQILRDALLKSAREGVPAPNDIAESEVREYYDAHQSDFRDPERRRLSVIVLSTEGAANAALEAARNTSATQWGELVRSRSIDPHAKASVPVDLAGDIGFVSPPGDPRGTSSQVPDAVRAAAFEIAHIGEVFARAVKADGKFYVVKVTSRSEAHERGFQDAERAIRVKLAQDRARAKEDALLDELRRQYPVQIDESALGQVNVAPAPTAPPFAVSPETRADAGAK